jgi:hypothetical protein
MPNPEPKIPPRPVSPRLRVVVRGNSTGVNVGPMRTARSDGTYSEMLERRLRARGLEAFVTNECTLYQRIHDLFPEWFAVLAQVCPDVVVLNYGGAECQPNVFPTSMLEWIQRRRATPPLGPVGRRVSKVVDRRLRRSMAHATMRISRRLGLRTWRLRPARFERELERMIRVIRGKTAGLVLVMTVSPAPPGVERLMARLNERCERYSEIIRGVVDRLDDPCVKVIDVGQVVEELGIENALYDGLHYTGVGHDAIAAQMERAITTWIDSGAFV